MAKTIFPKCAKCKETVFMQCLQRLKTYKSILIKIDAKIIEIGIKCILNQKEILKKFFKYLRKFNLDSRIFAKKVGVACAIAY